MTESHIVSQAHDPMPSPTDSFAESLSPPHPGPSHRHGPTPKSGNPWLVLVEDLLATGRQRNRRETKLDAELAYAIDGATTSHVEDEIFSTNGIEISIQALPGTR